MPTLEGWIAGENPTAAKLTKHTKTAIENAVYYKPYCYMSRGGGQSLATGIDTQLVLDTINEDTDGMADAANSRVIVRTAGRYRLTANISYAANATGYRGGWIKKNGGFILYDTHTAPSGSASAFPVTLNFRFAVNDIITLGGVQTSGVSLLTNGHVFQVEWMSM